jgi:hypothetical protein
MYSQFSRTIHSCVAVALVLIPSRAVAQQLGEDPVTNAPVRVGVIGLDPRFNLVNVGVDNNVFNETSQPKSDFTFTVQPSLSIAMRTGRGLLTATGRADAVYFNTYESERSLNTFGHGEYRYELNRLAPFISFSALDTRERPGAEIDARAQRFENTLNVGMDGRIASKSNLRLTVRRASVKFAGDAVFQTRSLENVLNRRASSVEVSWRQQLTSITTFQLLASVGQERFEYSVERNSNSSRADAGFEMGRFALIRGKAFVGYRRLMPTAGGTLPEFAGLTTNVDVAYTAPTQTRVSAILRKDIDYSFEILEPYYVQAGWLLNLTQRLVGRWEARLTGGQDRLSYRQAIVTAQVPRVDTTDRIGGGAGFEVRRGVTIGFMVEWNSRDSTLPGRRYQTTRSFGTVTYGL